MNLKVFQNNFLLINPFGIGDVLFTTPVVRAIKESYPESKIVYWCNERVKDILKNNPYIDKIFALSRGDLKRLFKQSKLVGIRKFLGLLTELKKENCKVLLDFSLDYRYSLISKLLGIKKRIGFNYKKRGRFLTHKIDIEGYNSKHIVEYYLELLRFLDIKPKSKKLDLFVEELNNQKIKNFFSKLGIKENDLIVGMVPAAGASWGKNATIKQWPPERFAQLADRLIKELNAKVILLGDRQERDIADKVIKEMKNKPFDFIGKTDLEDLVAVINNLSFLVTNDGGPLHLAVALGIKTISIFGPVDDLVYGPYPKDKNHIVIKKELPCRPCYKNFKIPICKYNLSCLKTISVDDVFKATLIIKN